MDRFLDTVVPAALLRKGKGRKHGGPPPKNLSALTTQQITDVVNLACKAKHHASKLKNVAKSLNNAVNGGVERAQAVAGVAYALSLADQLRVPTLPELVAMWNKIDIDARVHCTAKDWKMILTSSALDKSKGLQKKILQASIKWVAVVSPEAQAHVPAPPAPAPPRHPRPVAKQAQAWNATGRNKGGKKQRDQVPKRKPDSPDSPDSDSDDDDEPWSVSKTVKGQKNNLAPVKPVAPGKLVLPPCVIEEVN